MTIPWRGAPDWTDFPTGYWDAMRVRETLTECIVEAFERELGDDEKKNDLR